MREIHLLYAAAVKSRNRTNTHPILHHLPIFIYGYWIYQNIVYYLFVNQP